MYDGQEKVEVTAYQGEGRRPDENTLVGKFMIEGLADVPAGNALVLHFELDLNGLLKATATEKATGLSRSVTMDTRASHVIDIEQAKRNVESLVGEETSSAGTEESPETLLMTSRDLRKRAEKKGSTRRTRRNPPSAHRKLARHCRKAVERAGRVE
jgi:molecular chaperone DnaK (HSP70)